MSALSRLRRKVNYETNVPRCETCVHFRRATFYLRDSLPRPVPPHCKHHSFEVKAMAVCDEWRGTNGETLT